MMFPVSAYAQDTDEEEATAQSAPRETIVVTGSRIAGVAPVGATVTTLGRQEIEASGEVTLDRMIRELPQVLDLGFSENSRGQSGGNGNATYSNSINLRGLGPFSTLIISDGHRMTNNGRAIDPSVLPTLGVERVEVIADGASAIYGSDAVAGVVNLIPRRSLDGVEAFGRIGSSEDGDFWEWNAGVALGKVFDRGQIMVAYEHAYRSNLSGDDRDFFTSDQRPFGGPDYRVNTCAPGTLIYQGQTYALPANYDGSQMLTAGTENLCEALAGQDLFPEQEYDSVNSTGTFAISDMIEVFYDGYYSKRRFSRSPGAVTATFTVPESNAFFVAPDFYVPGSGGYQIAYNFGEIRDFDQYEGFQENWQITPGLRVNLPNDWIIEGRIGYGEATDRADNTDELDSRGPNSALAVALRSSDPSTALDPYSGGRTASSTVESIFGGFRTFPTDAELTTYQLGANGPLFDWAGGEVALAVGYEGQDFTQTRNPGTPTEETSNRKVDSFYAELLVPIFGPGNATPGFEELELTAAVRHDNYSDVGSTTNPKFGINWEPADGVRLRGSFGTSFRAPTFPEIFGNSSRLFIQAYTNPDPTGPSRVSGYTYGSGPNPDLQPETATTWTVGADFDVIPDLTFGFTYFDISYEDTISGLLSNLSVLALADEYAGTDVILFGQPALTRINELIAQGKPILQFPGTTDDCTANQNPDACIFVDGRSLNLGRSQMQGIDFNMRYFAELGPNDFLTFQANGTYLTAYEVAFTPGGDFEDLRNEIYQPLKFRARASVTWEHGPFTTRLQANHIGGYDNTLTTPVQDVDSYTPIDLSVTWDLVESLSLGMVDRAALTLEVRNLFDVDPPYVNVAPSANGGGGYDATVANPVGRQFAVSLRTSF
ncbi:TonB-dependent receptor domain-containing protein [Aurantiacibacter gilvus]|uniref:TonB-dependent receptor n=1 Tax=Aurantiacibacter gilvus TaxID=3139141 RepID=A0ABU9IFY8_9SPHN